MDEKGKFPSLDLIFELARDKLHFQSEQWNAIDQKNAIVLAVYGIILAIYSGADTSVFTEFRTLILSIWLASIILGICCSLLSIRPRVIDIPPNIENLSEKYLEYDEYDTKNVLLSTFEEKIAENYGTLDIKTRFLSFSINIFLPLALGVSVIAIFLKMFFGGN